MRLILALLLTLASFQARSEVPADPRKDAFIAKVLAGFWDNARDSNGNIIRPPSEQERHEVPIPTSVAYRAIEAGEISGQASRCGLRWIHHTESITVSARNLGMTETQVAFVNALRDAKQMQVMKSRTLTCHVSDYSRVEHQLRRSTRLGLEVASVSRGR